MHVGPGHRKDGLGIHMENPTGCPLIPSLLPCLCCRPQPVSPGPCCLHLSPWLGPPPAGHCPLHWCHAHLVMPHCCFKPTHRIPKERQLPIPCTLGYKTLIVSRSPLELDKMRITRPPPRPTETSFRGVREENRNSSHVSPVRELCGCGQVVSSSIMSCLLSVCHTGL